MATVTRDDTMLRVLEILVNKSLSAIPVVDKEGEFAIVLMLFQILFLSLLAFVWFSSVTEAHHEDGFILGPNRVILHSLNLMRS